MKFKQLLLLLEKKHVPKKGNATNKNKKAIWLTYKAKNLVLKKRTVFAKYKDKDHQAVRKINKKASKEVKKAKRNFEKKLAQNIKNDVKSYYAYVRSKCKSKVKLSQLVADDGTLTGSDQEVAEEFNKCFSTVFTLEDRSCLPTAD